MTDQELWDKTRLLVEKEKAMTLEIIKHLSEVEMRKLHLERGFGSMFDYAVKYLGYSENEAHPRIQAARLLREMPEVEEKIKSGVHTLSNLAQAQSFFRREKTSPEEKKEILEKLENKSLREVRRELASLAPESIPKERLRQLTKDKVELRTILSEDLREKLDHLKELLSHKNPNMTYAELIEIMANATLEKLERKSTKSPKPSRTRYIPQAIKAKYGNGIKAAARTKIQKPGESVPHATSSSLTI